MPFTHTTTKSETETKDHVEEEETPLLLDVVSMEAAKSSI
jgi:hypothetical protein